MHDAVALLPGPEQLGTDSGPFGQLTDPNIARSGIGRGLVALLFEVSPIDGLTYEYLLSRNDGNPVGDY